MSVHAVTGVTAKVLPDGRLRLRSRRTGVVVHCPPRQAAMWIALSQHNGDQTAAADMLAGVWDVAPAAMRADFHLWIDEMRSASLLEER